MNWKTMVCGFVPRYMDEAGGEGGGGDPAAGAEGNPAPVSTDGAGDGKEGGKEGAQGDPAPQGGDGTGEGKDGTTGDPKPFLGEEKKDEPPKPATEADYLKSMVKDEQLLGTDKTLQFDPDYVKAMIPEAQKLGVSPETMGKLANAFAKVQIEQGRNALKNRIDYFNRMKEESMKRYTPQDFATINAGIDHWFKPNGIMNNVIRNSELGADPEFLALMHYLGSRRSADGLAGAEGAGGSSADPNSTEGLAKMW